MTTNIKIKKLRESAIVPTYATKNSAGADLYADITEEVTINPHETKQIPTGVAFEIPEGLVGLLFARSGLSCKKGLAPANKVGVIDSDFRGEVMVMLHNHTNEPKTIDQGDRVAQLCFVPYVKGDFEICEELSSSDRGVGGFGSTGK